MSISKFIGAVLLMFAANAWAAVDINTASVADLDSIKGIGPGTSAKILEQRKSGKFKDWADLIERVSGIGDKRASKLSAEGLTVNGAAYASMPNAKSAAAASKSMKADTNTPVKKP